MDAPTALIVGATKQRGIGRAIATRLARRGHPVAVTGTGAVGDLPEGEAATGWNGAHSTAQECRDAGVAAVAIDLDVTDSAQIDAAVEQTQQRLGPIGVLVYNATFSRGPDRLPLADLDLDLWRRVVDINLTGAAATTQRVLPGLCAGGGSIVYISSIAATQGMASATAYSASKAGLHALAASVALEVASADVSVNVVVPGFIDTARVDALRSEDRWSRRLSTIPMGRPGSVDEVAELVAYLTSSQARWMTGQALILDGGETLGVNRG